MKPEVTAELNNHLYNLVSMRPFYGRIDIRKQFLLEHKFLKMFRDV